jgi:hypothetical protein
MEWKKCSLIGIDHLNENWLKFQLHHLYYNLVLHIEKRDGPLVSKILLLSIFEQSNQGLVHPLGEVPLLNINVYHSKKIIS